MDACGVCVCERSRWGTHHEDEIMMHFGSGHHEACVEPEVCAWASTFREGLTAIPPCHRPLARRPTVAAQVLMTRPRGEWFADAGTRYRALADLTHEAAQLQVRKVWGNVARALVVPHLFKPVRVCHVR
eukprot:363986-Chlamydomonas_euryale.AAC.20